METKNRNAALTEKDIEEGKKLNELFGELSENGKLMATVYLSALRDKEVLDEKAG